MLNKILIFLLFLVPTIAFSQVTNVGKGAAVIYTNGQPTGIPRVQYDSEFAIDITTSRIWRFNRTNSVWVLAGSMIGKANSNAAPSTAPKYGEPEFVMNNMNNLYWYNGSVWNCLNCGLTPYTAGTGINVTGTVITNTAPDQTVNLSGAGISVITGAYPNYTVTSTEIDGSITNEIQQIDSFILSNDTLYLSLSSDGIPQKFVVLTGLSASTGGGIYGVSDTVSYQHQATLDSGLTFYSDKDSAYFQTLFDIVTYGTQVRQVPDSIFLKYNDIGGTNRLDINQSGINLFTQSPDRVIIQGNDARYTGDYRATFDSLSITHKDYNDDTYLQYIDTLRVSNDTLYISLIRDSLPESFVVLPASAGGVDLYELDIITPLPAVDVEGSMILKTVDVNGSKILYVSDGTSWIEGGMFLDTLNVATINIGNNQVTYAKIQQVAASSLLGNPTGSTANISGITLGTGLTFSGTMLVNSSPDQTVSLTGGGITNITGTYPSFTITSTEVDGSITNEIQRLDTLEIVSNTLRASILNDGVPFSSVNLSPYLDNTDTSGYNIAFTRSNDTLYLQDGSSTLFAVLPSGMVDTDNQNLTLSNDTLYIEDGNFVLLSQYLDNTDTSGYNLSFTRSNDTLYLRDGSSTLFTTLPSISSTDLSITGASSPLTLNSSTGTDVTITGGTGITLAGTSGNVTITNSSPNVTTNLTFTGASSPYTLNSSDGTDVTFVAGTKVSLSRASNALTINANGDTLVTLSGTIRWEHNLRPLKDVMVSVSGTGVRDTAYTDLMGYWHMQVPIGRSYIITPSHFNGDVFHGVDDADVDLIQDHVNSLGLSGYKMIAADVNNSGDISSFDRVTLNSALLNNPSAITILTANSWVFVTKESNYTCATAYSVCPFISIDTVVATTTISNIDFIGVKRGDLNGSGGVLDSLIGIDYEKKAVFKHPHDLPFHNPYGGDSTLLSTVDSVIANIQANTDTSGYNISFSLSNDTLYLADGDGLLFVELPPSTDAQTLSVDSFDIGGVTERFAVSISNGNTVYIDVPQIGGLGGGQNNVGVNLGSGTGIYAGKADTSLQFKSLIEGYGIDYSNTSTEITIKVDTAQIATSSDINVVQADIDAHELADGDLSATNEGSLTVGVGGANSSTIISNTSGSTAVTIDGSGIITISETGSTITIGATEIDGSTTNEIQQVDTFEIISDTLRLSLSSDEVPFKSVDLSSYLDNTDAQSLTLTGTSPYTIDISGSTDDIIVSSGTGITLTESPANTLVITNSAPDQTVTLTEGSNVTITGTYPNFTIAATPGAGVTDLTFTGTGTPYTLNSSTGTDVTFEDGTGISITRSSNELTITNSAPDQTVSLTGAGITNVTGTYPTFTITSTEVDGSTSNELQNVSYTAATRAVAISSGTGFTFPTFATAGTDAGLVAGSNGATTSFLRGDNTWQSVITTEVDGSISNEGVLGVGAGSGTSSTLVSTTSGANAVTINAAGILTISESTSANGGSITLTATEVDGSTSNELQTYGHAGTTTYTNTLSGGGGSWSITGAGIAAISQTAGAITVTATEVDGSTTNEIQDLTLTGTGPYVIDISSSSNDVTVSAGTGIGLSESPANTLVITNSAPDQTVTLTEGSNVTITGTYPNFTIAATPGAGVTDLTFTGAATPYTLNSSTGTDVTFAAGSGVTLSRSSNELTITAVDASTTNELQNIFQTISVSGQSDVVADGTTDALTLVNGTGITITTNAGTDAVTITNSSPDQTVSLTNGGGVAVSGTYPSFTLTATDQSTTNEAWTIDGDDAETEVISNQTVKFQGAGITATDYDAATNVLLITSTEVDGSITNEIQNLSYTAATGVVAIDGSGSTDATITVMTASTRGLTPDGDGSGTDEFLREDATWGVPPGVADLTLSGSGPYTLNSSTGTDVTFSQGSGITLTRNVNDLSIAAIDASATNELQTIANTSNATSHTVTLSNSGGTVQLVEGTGVTLTTTGTSGAGIVTIAATNTGTVTNFSAGDLSPLFTTTEATTTTTPALSFSLSNAGANTYLGNATGSTAAPSYTTAGSLTKTDDTNVTLTLGGAPTTSLLASTSLTLGWTGQLAVSRGGTGAGTLTGLLQGNGTSAVTAITNSSTVGQTLRVTGASTYAWGALDLADTDAITGNLPVGNLNSGTGASATTFWAGNGTWATPTGTAADLTIGGTGPTYTIESSTGTDVTISGAGIITLSETPTNTLVITGTETDGSISNEGSLTAVDGTNQVNIVSNTSGSTAITLLADVGIAIEQSLPNLIEFYNTGDVDASDDITGSGVSGRIPYFNGTQTVTSDADLTFNGAQVGIGTSPSASYRLYVKQSTTTDGIFIERSSASTGFSLYQDDASYISGTGNLTMKTTGGTITLEPPGGNSFIQGVTIVPTAAKTDTFAGSAFLNIAGTYSPSISSSLTGYPSMLRIATVINQTGGANQPMNGMLIEPTITAAPNDFRGIHYRPATHTFLWQPSGDTVRSFFRGKVGIGPDRSSPQYRLDIGGTEAIRLPIGTTAQRPSLSEGIIRYNSTVGVVEWCDGSDWQSALGGGTGITDLTFSGTSSPVTLNSSSGTDVTFTAGTGITLSATSGNITITNSVSGGSGDINNGGNTTGAAITIGTNDAFDLNFETSGVTRMNITGGASTGGVVTLSPVVTNTTTVADIIAINATSSGSTNDGFGGAIKIAGENDGGSLKDMARISTNWEVSANTEESSFLDFETVTFGGSLTKVVRISGNSGGVMSVGTTTPVNLTQSTLTPQASFSITSGSTLTLTSSVASTNAIRITTADNAATSTSSIAIGNSSSYTQTSGNRNLMTFGASFAPTSGTAVHNQLAFTSTFNQTGGANGITRSVNVNPTLTALADYRALEFTASYAAASGTGTTTGLRIAPTYNLTGTQSGTQRGVHIVPTITALVSAGQFRAVDIDINNSNAIGIYQSGASTTNNLVGSTMLGSTSAPSRMLHVTGEVRITDLVTDNPTVLVGADADGDLSSVTLGDGLAYSTTTLSANTVTAAPSVDLTASGERITLTANENQAFGDLVYIASDGDAAIADADAIATGKVIGMCTATVTTGNPGVYLLRGVARKDAWAWTVGGYVYLSTTGTSTNTMTQTAPSGTDDCVVIVGIATHADRILINIDPTVVEIK